MNDADFDLAKLDEKERAFYDKIKGLTDQAYKVGYMAGIKSILEDGEADEEDGIRRFYVTPSTLIAGLIIVIGGIFSLGMYIGGLNG